MSFEIQIHHRSQIVESFKFNFNVVSDYVAVVRFWILKVPLSEDVILEISRYSIVFKQWLLFLAGRGATLKETLQNWNKLLLGIVVIASSIRRDILLIF